MPKHTGGGPGQKVVYPPGCKEILEDLPSDDMIRRMKDVAMAYQQMSQEDDNSAYVPLAMYLANDYFLEHPSKDVRLLVACAIADVFRVYAPNAPYQSPTLIKKIFLFFIQQLKGLQDPKDPTFKRYFYLLENLAWVKSFNICIELEDSQDIFCRLFALIFKIVNDNHSEKVKNFMLDMLTPLIVESDTVSFKLLEIILWQIIEPRKSSNKQAHWLATSILRKAGKTLEPYLISYFNNALTHGVGENAGELSDEEGSKPKQVAPKVRGQKTNPPGASNVASICELIYELNTICPPVMEGILPQLEFKVKSNDERERIEYTKLLARLFSDKNSNLADKYPDLWRSFLGRFRDISVTVRMRCVQYSMHFLVNHAELRLDITEQLKQRQHDPDENVRHEVVMAIISAAKKSIDNINEDLLSFVKERTLDKKFKIRREALYGMAQLYKQYILSGQGEGVFSSTNSALRMLNWIKNKCLHNYYQTQLDDRLLVERILNTCLIPYSLPLEQRMKVLYSYYCTIDNYAQRAFNELLRQQQLVRKMVKELIQIIKEDKSEERDTLMKQKILMIAKNLPEPVKADEYLTKLCRNLELNPALRHHMELIVTSMDAVKPADAGIPETPPSSSTIEASVREVLKSLGFPVQTNSFYMIIKQLMERIAPIMVDHQGLLMLFDFVNDSFVGDGEQDAEMGLENSSEKGLRLILSLSAVFPAIFHGREIFSEYLLPFLWQSTDQPQISEIILQILTNVGASAGSSQINGTTGRLTSVPWWAQDEEVIDRIINKFILDADTPKQAKYAVQCLNAIISDDNEKMKVFGKILDKIKETGMSLETSSNFRVHMVAIGMIAVTGGHIYFPKLLRSIVQKFVVQGLLLRDNRSEMEIHHQEEQENNREVSEHTQSVDLCSEEVKAKIEGIKLICRWLHGLKLSTLAASMDQQQNVIDNYQKHAQNSLQLLKTIIQTDGDLNEKGTGGTTIERAHLKLSAAMGMLKIVGNDAITGSENTRNGDSMVIQATTTTSPIMTAQQWHVLAQTVIDPQDFVREKFALKLHKGLMTLSLGLEFLAILSLGGTFTNETQFKAKLRNYLNLNIAKRRDLIKTKQVINLRATFPDCVMPYVIHLIAHMPFYTKYDEISQLEVVKECLWFIMEPLVLRNEQYSFSFFKKTFENIKTCIDRVSAVASGSQEIDLTDPSQMATMTNYKIYCACDLALGLVMSKTQNFLLKESAVQPTLPAKYFIVSPLAQDNNLKCYLPPEMQFAPPKRCGLEAEILGKITKQYDQQRQMQPQPVVQAPPLRSRPQKQGVQQGTQQVLVISSDSVLDEGGDVIIETAEEHAGQVHVQSLPPNVTTSTPIPQQQRMRSAVQSHTEEAFSSSESETPVPTTTTSTRTRKQDLSAASKRALPDESDQQEMVQPTKRSRGASETVAVPALRSTRGGSRSTTATTSVEVAKSPTKSTDNEEGGTEESSHDEAESYQPARRGRGVRGSKASASQQETATESEDAEEERGNSPPRKSGRRPQPKARSPEPEPAKPAKSAAGRVTRSRR